MHYSFQVNFKICVILIGVLHLGLACLGLQETVAEYIYEQEPVQLNQVLYLAAHFIFQLFLVCTLIVGSVKRISLLLLPWLITTCGVFTLATVFTVLQFTREKFFLNSLTNVLISGFFWVMWYIVYIFFNQLRNQRTSNNVIYGKLPTSEVAF